MRSLLIGFLLGMAISAMAQTKAQPHEIKIKIEASEWNKNLLLKKLNANAEGHGLLFDESEQNYEYRVVFGTGQRPVATQYGDINASLGTTTVFDAQGNEMFDFNRQGRWTDSGATNAVAKEIVKRLVKMRSPTPK